MTGEKRISHALQRTEMLREDNRNIGRGIGTLISHNFIFLKPECCLLAAALDHVTNMAIGSKGTRAHVDIAMIISDRFFGVGVIAVGNAMAID